MSEPTINKPMRAEWSVLISLYILIFLIGTETFLISPVLPAIAMSLKATIADTASIVVVYVLIYAILGPFLGIVSDFKGRKPLILFGCIIFVIGNLMAGYSTSLSELIFSRIITGLGAASAGPSIWAFIGDTTHNDIRGRLMGWGMASFSLGQILGVPLGSLLAMKLGWNSAFISISILSLFIFLILFFSLKKYSFTSKSLSVSNLFSNFKIFAKSKKLILALGVTFFWAAANLGSYTYLGTLLKDRFSWNTEKIGFVIVFVGLGSFVGALTAGKFIDYWRSKGGNEAILSGVLAFMLGLFVMTLTFFDNALIAVVSLFFWFIASGAFVTSQQTLLTLLSPDMKGAAISMNNSIMYAGTAMGVTLIGMILQNTWSHLGWAALIFSLLSLLTTFGLKRKNSCLSEG